MSACRLQVERIVNGQYCDRTMPLWRCHVPDIGRIRMLLPLSLRALPKGQRVSTFGQPVFVNSRTLLVVRRRQDKGIPASRIATCQGFLRGLRFRAPILSSERWCAGRTSRISGRPGRHPAQRTYLRFEPRELGQRPCFPRKDRGPSRLNGRSDGTAQGATIRQETDCISGSSSQR